MPFVIYEQGVRIITPPNRIFPEPTVAPTQATERTAAVAPNESKTVEIARQAQQGMQVYQRQQQGEREREPVRRADEIMNRSVVTLPPDANLATAWQLFQSHHFRHVPIVDTGKHLQGVLADRDIWLRLSDWRHYDEHQTVADVMVSRVITATPDTEIRLMAGAMADNHIGSVPIVNDDGVLLGLVTRTDILRLLVSAAPLELWA